MAVAPPTIGEDASSIWNALFRVGYYGMTHLYSFCTQLAAFVTLTLPRWAFITLSWGATVTLQLNFTKVAVTLILGATIISYYWKVKYLNRYTTLKEEPLFKDEAFDLHPDIAAEQAPPGFHNYLDEFLSAIKVFGYLEKPVFHELARHLQTRRLVAGDTLNLDQDKSFYIVVDGSVQVFAHTGTDTKQRDAYDDEDDNGYQLLNNVESGGTLSSLFTILSLFTEDVKLRYEEEDTTNYNTRNNQRKSDHDVTEFALDEHLNLQSARNANRGTANSSAARQLSPDSRNPQPRPPSSFSLNSTATGESESDGTSTIAETAPAAPNTSQRPSLHTINSLPTSPGLSATTPSAASARSGFAFEPRQARSRETSYLDERQREGSIARATTDTTLAVIPAEAFRRLTKKFPNAAAHIVQVILTRLQRVTFLTAHKYLGLTREVIRTEKAINELACYPLPKQFWDSGGIQRLRQRFVPETKIVEEDEHEENDTRGYFGMDTPYAGPSMGKVFWDDSENNSAETSAGIKLKYRAPPTARSSRSSKKAGDLLSMSSSASEERLKDLYASPLATPRTERASSKFIEDFDLRDAVMESISKAIGLVQSATTPAVSVDASPMFRPQDTNLQQKAVFNSSFGSLSFLGLNGFDDESSVTGSSATNMTSALELENEVEILYFAQGSVLVKEGEKNSGLYFVIEGFLDVSMPEDSKSNQIKNPAKPQHPQQPTTNLPPSSSASSANGSTGVPPSRRGSASPAKSMRIPQRPSAIPRATQAHLNEDLPPLESDVLGNQTNSIHLFTVKAGGIAGYLSSLSGFPSYVDICAKTEAYVGFLPAKALERIMDKKPIVLLTLAKRLISLLSPLILHIDSALDWQHVSAGQVIYRQGEPADSFYIVINGRLRSINDKLGGGVHVHSEYGQGESVGELDCITASARPTTLHAIRDSELARMPMTLFNAISVRHPLVTIQMSRIIASRLRQQLHSQHPQSIQSGENSSMGMGKNNFNLKTVAILPINRHVPVSEFATKLHAALEAMGAGCSYLNQATVMQVLGRHAFSRMGTLKLAGWLAETEQKYRIVLYVADTAVSAPWTQTCIRQADCIFLVADGGTEPNLGEYEKLLVGMKTTARKELILLHSERNVLPGTTRPWLRHRPWIHAHHHIEMLGATPAAVDRTAGTLADPGPVIALRKIAKRVELQIGKYRKRIPLPVPDRPLAMNDFARLARRLCGKSIGIVLGGGGARGISHIGVLRALGEHGIPVDMVGGTSIGAFVGGLYAREGEMVSTFGRAKRFSGRMSTLWRILTDLTYPVVAYTTGHEFNRGIYKSFYDLHIEDMWLPYFCNTTNITHSRMEVHVHGYAWRYIRASMSLAGLLPPLCDEGDMLVDGGYVDNLPVSVMLSMGAASVFAVDVGSVDDTSPRDYGESLSGWWLLLQKWNPFAAPSNIPNITEIQSRLTYVSSVKTLEEAKATPGVLYMRMPVTQFGTMEFKRFTEILDVGYSHAQKQINEWAKQGQLPTGTEGEISDARLQKRGLRARRNSI